MARLAAPAPRDGVAAITKAGSGLTGEGTILGTLQYMSPEQLAASEVDARSDIFAFGAVLYEMATGRPAFEASSQAGLIAAILEHDAPSLSASGTRQYPPALDRVVRRCLAKDPEDRWQSARDVVLELRAVSSDSSSVPAAATAAGPLAARRRRARTWLVAGALVSLLATRSHTVSNQRLAGTEGATFPFWSADTVRGAGWPVFAGRPLDRIYVERVRTL